MVNWCLYCDHVYNLPIDLRIIAVGTRAGYNASSGIFYVDARLEPEYEHWTVGACIVITSLATFLVFPMPLLAVGSVMVWPVERSASMCSTRLQVRTGLLVLIL